MLLDPAFFEGFETHVGTAGDEGWKEHLGLQCRQNKDIVLGRLLEHFQKGVRCLFRKLVSVLQDHYPIISFKGAKPESGLKAADLVNLDERAFPFDRDHIRMVTRMDLAAGRADVAAVQVPGGLAIEKLCQFKGHGGFPDAGHSAEEQGMRNVAASKKLLQKAFRSWLTRDTL
jgi:hypothetical protein